jgi:hypothetical protein
MRFRPGDVTMEKIEAPDMRYMRAVALSGYENIWFAGTTYDSGDEVVGNYYRGTWTFYEDPSPTQLDYLHFFSRFDGWGFSGNRIYRFDSQGWYLWLELPAWKSLKPCAFKSSTNVWAVGYPADAAHLGNAVLHYDGAAWREVFAPGENKYVYDVAMRNNSNGWAVGAEKVGTTYYGRTWQCVNGVWIERVCPVEESLREVEVVSKIQAWALTSGKILHYQTGSNITPTSFGRIKTLFAAARGSDSDAPAARASCVPPALPPTMGLRTGRYVDAGSKERPAEAGD